MEVTSIENRSGDDSYPFGFVYFDDETRVVYATKTGVHTFQGPYWKPSTAKHVAKAKAALAKEFPGIDFNEAPRNR
jgi:hypothetical protein